MEMDELEGIDCSHLWVKNGRTFLSPIPNFGTDRGEQTGLNYSRPISGETSITCPNLPTLKGATACKKTLCYTLKARAGREVLSDATLLTKMSGFTT